MSNPGYNFNIFNIIYIQRVYKKITIEKPNTDNQLPFLDTLVWFDERTSKFFVQFWPLTALPHAEKGPGKTACACSHV